VTTPFPGEFVVRWLGRDMKKLHTNFEASKSTRRKETKGNVKGRNLCGFGWLGVTKSNRQRYIR